MTNVFCRIFQDWYLFLYYYFILLLLYYTINTLEKNSKPKRKSQFFDTDPTEELDGAETIENAKRKSKSKFYKDLPITKSTDSLDTASIGSTNCK